MLAAEGTCAQEESMLNLPLLRSMRSPRLQEGAQRLPKRHGRATLQVPKPGAPALPWAEMNKTLDATTRSQAYTANEVCPLFNGIDGWPARLQQMADASIILIKTYEFLNDSAGREMVARLRARARAGCKVVIQYDFKGTAEFPRYTVLRSTPKVLWPLRGEPNVLLVPCYIPRHWQYLALPCCHKKYFITFVPNRPATLLTGGMNVGDKYRYGGLLYEGAHRIHAYRDTDVLVRGPVVQDAVSDFLRDLIKRAPAEATDIAQAVRNIEGPRTYAATGKQAETRLVISAPLDKENPQCLPRMFEALLGNVPGGQTVLISNAFFSPLKATRKAMIAATKRGVRFVILNNAADVHDGFGSFMGFISHAVMRRLFRQVSPGSMRLYEWHSSPSDSLCSIHQKITVFGDTGPVWVGSANLDTVSAERNHESVLLVQEPTLRHHFQRHFYDDLQRGNVCEVTPEVFERESFLKRYCERIALMIFRNKV